MHTPAPPPLFPLEAYTFVVWNPVAIYFNT